jgi:hypothetical protein
VGFAKEEPSGQLIVLLVERAAGHENPDHDESASRATKTVRGSQFILASTCRAVACNGTL